jgi:hypothetical protein
MVLRFKLRLVVVADDDQPVSVDELVVLDKECDQPEQLGLTLQEAKTLLLAVQRQVLNSQIATFLAARVPCPTCRRPRGVKDHKTIVFRTVFGTLELVSPRLRRCPCQHGGQASTSPLVELLPEHTARQGEHVEYRCVGRNRNVPLQVCVAVSPAEHNVGVLHDLKYCTRNVPSLHRVCHYRIDKGLQFLTVVRARRSPELVRLGRSPSHRAGGVEHGDDCCDQKGKEAQRRQIALHNVFPCGTEQFPIRDPRPIQGLRPTTVNRVAPKRKVPRSLASTS